MPFEISTDKKLIAESERFYHNNINSIRLFYRPLNELIPFLFKNKIDTFYEKIELFLQVRDEKSNVLHNRVSYAYATGDYHENALHHFHFKIDGKNHIYSIVELDMYGIIDKANKIKKQLSDDKGSNTKNNVLQFKR